MRTLKHMLAGAALALAAALPAASHAQGMQALSEGFSNVAMLTGWELINNSTPAPGEPWFQGTPGVFTAHEGADDAYLAANYFSAAGGEGAIDNWLITPVLDLPGPTTLTFFTRGASIVGYNDTLEIRFSPGSGSGANGFTTLLATIGGANPFPTSWEQFSLSLPFVGIGRFAFHYTGAAGTSNYIGVDTVSVLSVPEPSAWMMLGAGVFALVLLRRKRT